MTARADLPAGRFSAWLAGMRAALIEGRGVDVPCGECTACCTSSYFVHIESGETQTLARIAPELVFAAPGAPGRRLLGYDRRGRCPMLSAAETCSIYDDRPLTCRVYDCRVFAAAGVASPEAVATAGWALVALSAPFEAADGQVKSFLFSHMYRHPQVQAVRDKADAIVRRLFEAYIADPSLMPPDWAAKAAEDDPARAVADYIAGMTDRFAVHEHARLFDGPPDLR